MAGRRTRPGQQRAILAFLIGLSLASLSPAPGAPAAERKNDYFLFKSGLYYPKARFELNDFTSGNSRSRLESSNGFNGEISIGHTVAPLLGIELGAGFFENKASPENEQGETRIRVVPVRLSGKLFLPVGPLEPYGEVGVGAYVTKLEVIGNLGTFSGSTRITYGFHGGVGVNVNVTDSLFFGIEGRYIQARPQFGGQPVRLNGYTATLDIGFRY